MPWSPQEKGSPRAAYRTALGVAALSGSPPPQEGGPRHAMSMLCAMCTVHIILLWCAVHADATYALFLDLCKPCPSCSRVQLHAPYRCSAAGPLMPAPPLDGNPMAPYRCSAAGPGALCVDTPAACHPCSAPAPLCITCCQTVGGTRLR